MNQTYEKYKKLTKDTEYELRKLYEELKKTSGNPMSAYMLTRLRTLLKMYRLDE